MRQVVKEFFENKRLDCLVKSVEGRVGAFDKATPSLIMPLLFVEIAFALAGIRGLGDFFSFYPPIP